jgi:hypothetical protein
MPSAATRSASARLAVLHRKRRPVPDGPGRIEAARRGLRLEVSADRIRAIVDEYAPELTDDQLSQLAAILTRRASGGAPGATWCKRPPPGR